jgi:hypothetical protein
MKLYTEEQLDRAMDFARGHHKMTDSQFIDSPTPIELPSDEEIEKANGYAYYGKPNGGKYIAFNDGAKWMRDKIQGDRQ